MATQNGLDRQEGEAYSSFFEIKALVWRLHCPLSFHRESGFFYFHPLTTDVRKVILCTIVHNKRRRRCEAAKNKMGEMSAG